MATARVTKSDKEARKEITAVLKAQKLKGVARNAIARSLFHFDFTEKQVGLIMDITPKSAHAAKHHIYNGTRERKPIENCLKLGAADLSKFLGNCKQIAGKE